MSEAGHTAESVAAQIGVDPKTVARWVTQDRIPQTRHRANVAELLRRDAEELWPDAARRRDPKWFRPWAEIEREALGLRWFESAVIPGLLQTADYARAVLASGPLAADAEDFVETRLRRQSAVLDRPRPPLVVFVIDEGALRRGAPGVLGPQFDHLAALAQRPNVMIHVLPLRAGLHPGQAGPFIIASTPEGDDVGYLDDQAAGRITNDVAPLWAVWDTVRSVALPRDQTVELLEARSWMI
ncbi:Scr1 family TA system antitoxin-like transcriptional regulator [Micromonospora sp. WMMD980]|uniref:Scr1 family TA system antitoxin-like transcriptional regulator n=1 Tax=Micromonospora sp. WMMD980 TaxID=3016088 RepID=UPI002415B74B|nr:Scr1 family TA system antitoxin-like transcriptional regulator [Micromonospora sp. WMMD980]MDG4799393.1 Scr1 family TA system antitoxin-like transcriptional regulator [Micromonospora sp. WMMD980]